jgi:hypothetical protein
MGDSRPGIRAVLERLELECRERGVRLVYDDLRSEGGLCRCRDCYYLIINRRASNETRARLIRDALERVRSRRGVPAPSPEPAAVSKS